MFFKKRKPKHEAIHIHEGNYEELVIDSEIPVLLDFYASWCSPCKVMSSIINELSSEFDGKVLVAKVNTEAAPKLSAAFKVKSIPTMVIIDKNEVVERFKGIVPKPNLEEILNEYSSPN